MGGRVRCGSPENMSLYPNPKDTMRKKEVMSTPPFREVMKNKPTPGRYDPKNPAIIKLAARQGITPEEWLASSTETPIHKERQMKTLDTKNYHGHPRFYELLQGMADLHSKKNHDYAGDDPLSNLRSSEAIGVPAWKGILIRLMDKWGRLRNFAKAETFEVKDESLTDTLMDNAVYSLLCIIVYEEGKEKT